MINALKNAYIDYEENFSLSSNLERFFFRLTLILFLIYSEIVVFSQFIYFSWVFIPMNFIIALATPIICSNLLKLFSKAKIKTKNVINLSKKKSILFYLFVFTLTFLYFIVWYIGFYPGFFSSDSIAQYEQAINGSYNNWHPAMHTWIFFTLPLKLFGTASAIIPMQMLYFSLAVAYLFYVLKKSGCSTLFSLLSYLYIILNPNTVNIMLYPWKDSAFAIFSLVVFTFLIRAYGTKGESLRSVKSIILFSLFVFLTSGMRHNGILLIAPIFVLLFIFMSKIRKQVLISAVAVIAASMIFSGPVLTLLSVEKPGQRQVEVLGLPMTVLANVYMTERDSMSEEAKAFMSSLATEDEWNDYHVTGNFNVIKWSSTQNLMDKIEAEGTKNILKYTFESLINAPIASLYAAINLTNLVWGFEGSGLMIEQYTVINDFGIENKEIPILTSGLGVFLRVLSLAGRYFFRFIGIAIIFLMLLAIGRIGKAGVSRALLILSPLCYNFGTMLLLTGPDYRFFHFNFIILIPLVYIIASESENIKSKKNIYIKKNSNKSIIKKARKEALK